MAIIQLLLYSEVRFFSGSWAIVYFALVNYSEIIWFTRNQIPCTADKIDNKMETFHLIELVLLTERSYRQLYKLYSSGS